MGIDMSDFIDSEGRTLKTLFARRLRQNSDVKKKVRRLIKSHKFKRLLKKGGIVEAVQGPERLKVLPAFQEMGKVIRASWKEERKKILKEIKAGRFEGDFINSEGEKLNELLKDFEDQEGKKKYIKLRSLRNS